MLDRLSASTLLRSVIAVMAVLVLILLTNGAWTSAQRLAQSNRIVSVAGVSGQIFTAMHKLRTDRASTLRGMNGDAVLTPEATNTLKNLRGAEVPALQATLAVVGSLDFADSARLVPELQQEVQKITALQAETWDAVAKPKAERRDGLGKEYNDTALALLATLDTLSTRLFAAIEHDDPYIDQMMELKQLAWTVRDTAGNAVFERAFLRIYESIREGETIAQPLKEARIVDDIVVNMIDVGEETGELDSMLNKIADNYDEEVETAVESLVSLLEPIMIVILGGIVGFIVIALFLPLVTLISKLSG